VSQPSPALVSQDAVRPAPRVALLLLCAAYVLPGALGRSPWRNADLTATGVMVAMAEGRTPWLSPALGGVAVDAAPLPYSLGALSVMTLGTWLDPALAARVPLVLMLALTFALVWYAAFYFARTDAAQPVAFAFGGQADHVDYARAVGDSALLALMSTLGLLLLGHETTPELVQLASIALLMWGMAAAPFRSFRARAALVVALPMLATSGAPIMACVLALTMVVIAKRSQYVNARAAIPWLLMGLVVAVLLATALQQWQLSLLARSSLSALLELPTLIAWFLWPSWLLAAWTLWQWRRQALHRHIAVPLAIAVVAVGASAILGGYQRALLMALPALAVLAAFAMPTLKRSTGAAIDWFSIFVFTGSAVFVWLAFVSLHAGVPAWPANRVDRLYTGYERQWTLLSVVIALAATLAWAWLVRWRTGRHRRALWKSLVLPASGVALTWLLLMTLLLPLADYTRGMTAWARQLSPHIAPGACVAAPRLSPSYVAALELHGRWTVHAQPDAMASKVCTTALMVHNVNDGFTAPEGWRVVARIQRPTERHERTTVLKRET
jgi:4-amino-4-deoxy-L-arabinose transferase-like glycosyltransferase